MKKKICFVVCTVILILGFSFALSSCNSGDTLGINNAVINENGELILVYTDGSEQNLGIVVGKDGQDGKDGQIGQSGSDGKDGPIIITGEGTSVSAACAKGLLSSVSITSSFTATVHNSGFFPGMGGTRKEEYTSSGSGVIYKIDKNEGNAFIITNYHVVYDASSDTENGISDDICVYLYGSETEEKAIRASYVGGSLYYDIAVLSIENSAVLSKSDARCADVSDSDGIVIGDCAIAIGNAKGYGISTSQGIVSVDSEYIKMTAADGVSSISFRVMRHDAAVNSGNSGGGLYDDSGNLIGIVNAKVVDDGVESIGYAIPSNVATSIADNIIDYCYGKENERVQRAMIGITVEANDKKAVYDESTGRISIVEKVLVHEITENSLASGVLLAGDTILSVTVGENIKYVTRQYHIIDLMLDVRAGDVLQFAVLREGVEMTVSITVTEDCLSAY